MYQIALHVIILAFPGKHTILMCHEGTTFGHDFYVMRTQVTNTLSLYKLTNAFSLFICFNLVMKSMRLC